MGKGKYWGLDWNKLYSYHIRHYISKSVKINTNVMCNYYEPIFKRKERVWFYEVDLATRPEVRGRNGFSYSMMAAIKTHPNSALHPGGHV